jgi:hypothetical protein
VRYLERIAGERGIAIDGTPAAAWLKSRPDAPACKHAAAATFRRGRPLTIVLSAPAASLEGVRLHYRHVNQAESYRVEAMAGNRGAWSRTISGEYTNSPYALQYHFQLIGRDGTHWLWPGLNADLANQPYFVVRRAS